MVTIVDYGVGNLGSIQNMFKKIGVPSSIASTLKEIEVSTKILLPGVGAFDAAMEKLKQTGMVEVLVRRVAEGIPLMGICLGAQLLTEGSEEGQEKGLGILPARCVKFNPVSTAIKVPHMGWNEVSQELEHPVLDFKGYDEIPRFYFAHSYHFVTETTRIVVGNCEHGYKFPAVLASANVVAVQFHPEKSHRFGMRLLENFAAWME